MISVVVLNKTDGTTNSLRSRAICMRGTYSSLVVVIAGQPHGWQIFWSQS